MTKYQHYKGGIYKLLSIWVWHTETNERLVVYENAEGKVFARLYDMFFENVLVDGEMVPRFKEIKKGFNAALGEEWIMESCWLIEFKDGHKIIISEELYKQEEERNWAGRERICEEHWFDIRKCRQRNQGIGVYGF